MYFSRTAHFNRIWCNNNSTKDPTNADVKMMIHNKHINFNADFLTGNCDFERAEGVLTNDFCLDINEDGSYTAEICEKIPNKYR